MAKSGLSASQKPLPATRKRTSPPASVSPNSGTEPERSPPKVVAPESRSEVFAKSDKVREEFQLIFGQNLKAARLKAGLKQSEMATLTGLPQQYLSVIEAGQQNITIRTMALLAEVVDHDLLDLLRKALDPPTQK